ncbi:MAG: Gfo/Idh/MocA family oxidoreductase [Spirochaetota bacterium]
MSATHHATGKPPLRTLLVGGGRIGEVHARNTLTQVDGMQLIGVVEPDPSPSMKAVASGAGVEIVDRPGELLTSADAVIIALPTDLHEEVLAQAAAAGAHVLCEKPLAADLASARRMIEAAEKAGIVLQVGFNRRFDHNYRALRRPKLAWPSPSPVISASGGLFMDMSIHDFDMARFLTGDEVESVFARGACLVDDEIGRAGDIDTAVVTLRFASGSLGVVENSRRASYGYDQRAEIHGSSGTAESANDTESRVRISDGNGVHEEKPLHFFLERYRESFICELESFASAVAGKTQPEVTGRDGIEAMRIAEACWRSLETGSEVMLNDIVNDIV